MCNYCHSSFLLLSIFFSDSDNTFQYRLCANDLYPLDSIIKHMFVDWPNFLQTLHGYSILPFAPSHILSKAFHHHHHYTRYLSIILVTRGECYSQYMSERYVSTSILKPIISQPHLSKYHLVFAL